MNTRIRKRFSVLAGLVTDGEYRTNLYQIDVAMITVDQDPVMQNIAYDRVCYWIEEVFNDSVLIQDSDSTLEAHRATGRRVIAFDQAPIDGVVGLALFHKLTAIVQDNILIADVDISSAMGQDVTYLHSHDEIADTLTDAGWWTDPGPGWSFEQQAGNVVSLARATDWKRLNLHWKRTNKQSANTVTFTTVVTDDENK